MLITVERTGNQVVLEVLSWTKYYAESSGPKVSIVVILVGVERTSVNGKSVPLLKLSRKAHQKQVVNHGNVKYRRRASHVVVTNTRLDISSKLIRWFSRNKQNDAPGRVFSKKRSLRTFGDLNALEIIEQTRPRRGRRHFGEIRDDPRAPASEYCSRPRAARGSHTANRECVVITRWTTACDAQRRNVILQFCRRLNIL